MRAAAASSWVMKQRWERLLFLHWRVSPALLRELVPEPFEIDVMDGSGWVGLTPFELSHLRVRGLPPVPGARRFPETNLRTYVRLGAARGIWFFTLEATSPLAVAGSRLFYGLPYHLARMRVAHDGPWVRYESRRVSVAAPRFIARYRPTGPVFRAQPGSLEHFLTERYTLFTRRGEAPMCADISHAPWPLQLAEAEIEATTLPPAHGLPPPDGDLLLHYAQCLDTRAYRPRRAG